MTIEKNVWILASDNQQKFLGEMGEESPSQPDEPGRKALTIKNRLGLRNAFEKLKLVFGKGETFTYWDKNMIRLENFGSDELIMIDNDGGLKRLIDQNMKEELEQHKNVIEAQKRGVQRLKNKLKNENISTDAIDELQKLVEVSDRFKDINAGNKSEGNQIEQVTKETENKQS